MLFVWLMIMVLIAFADQLTKYVAIVFLQPIGDIALWPNVFHLTYLTNPGAALGMFSNHRWVFLTISTLAIIGVLIYLFRKNPTDKLQCLSLAFVVGGGIGNMVDRLVLHEVVDFLHVYIHYPALSMTNGTLSLVHGVYDFPVFNVADCFVTVGAGMMMLWAILGLIKESKKQKATQTVAAEAETEDADTVVYAEAEPTVSAAESEPAAAEATEAIAAEPQPATEDVSDAGE